MGKYSVQSRRIRKLQDDARCEEDKEFARLVKLRQPNMSNILRGDRLGLESLMQICQVLNANPWWVWTGEGERYRKKAGDNIEFPQLWALVEKLSLEEKLEIAARIIENLKPSQFED